jgi:hypothetical protein
MMIEFTTPSRRYIVASYGNGWAYNVMDQETGEEFFVQDHDAQQLQEESKHFENEDVLAQYLEALGE